MNKKILCKAGQNIMSTRISPLWYSICLVALPVLTSPSVLSLHLALEELHCSLQSSCGVQQESLFLLLSPLYCSCPEWLPAVPLPATFPVACGHQDHQNVMKLWTPHEEHEGR